MTTHARTTRRLGRAGALALLALLTLSWPASAERHDRDDRPPGDVSACVKVSAEAIYGAYGYDHYVHIHNGCDKAVRCTVTASSNPDPAEIQLEAGEKQTLTMFRGSPASEVSASARCQPAAAHK